MTTDLSALIDNIYYLSLDTGFSLTEIEGLSLYEYNRYVDLTNEKLKADAEVEKAKYKSISGMFSSLFGGLKLLGGRHK